MRVVTALFLEIEDRTMTDEQQRAIETWKTDSHITNLLRVIGAGDFGSEQVKAVIAFRQQHPEYADGDLRIEVAEDNRSLTIRPKADPAFSVKYYMVEPVEELEEEEV